MVAELTPRAFKTLAAASGIKALMSKVTMRMPSRVL